MNNEKQLWELVQKVARAFFPFYRDAMQQVTEDAEIGGGVWHSLQMARGTEPAPFSVEAFQLFNPYSAPERLRQRLEDLAILDLFERVGEQAFRLTDVGREAVEDIYAAVHQSLNAITPLPPADMVQINTLLARLVDAVLAASEPREKRAILNSRMSDPGGEMSDTAKTDQLATDLYYFRDDAHLGAWRPHAVSGHVWEALTFIWRGDASSADELAEKLPFRGHSVSSYQEALNTLIARGWIELSGEGYSVTEQGRRLRQLAEDETDRIFFAPWASLDESDRAQLSMLLEKLASRLEEMAQRLEGQEQEQA